MLLPVELTQRFGFGCCVVSLKYLYLTKEEVLGLALMLVFVKHFLLETVYVPRVFPFILHLFCQIINDMQSV